MSPQLANYSLRFVLKLHRLLFINLVKNILQRLMAYFSFNLKFSIVYYNKRVQLYAYISLDGPQ